MTVAYQIVNHTKGLCPGPLRRWLGQRLKGWSERSWQKNDRKALQLTGGRVLAGPFEGLSYAGSAYGSALPPKLFGTYELELRDAVEAIIALRPASFVDLGAAEGYYAVGLLTRLPDARGMAFEMSPEARQRMQQLAERNGVADRIDVRHEATPELLDQCLEPGTPVICDIDGPEFVIMDPDRVPALRRCPLLVELHKWEGRTVDQVADEIGARFADTHDVEVIEQQPRSHADLPAGVLSKGNLWAGSMLAEYRTRQLWLWAQPR